MSNVTPSRKRAHHRDMHDISRGVGTIRLVPRCARAGRATPQLGIRSDPRNPVRWVCDPFFKAQKPCPPWSGSAEEQLGRRSLLGDPSALWPWFTPIRVEHGLLTKRHHLGGHGRVKVSGLEVTKTRGEPQQRLRTATRSRL